MSLTGNTQCNTLTLQGNGATNEDVTVSVDNNQINIVMGTSTLLSVKNDGSITIGGVTINATQLAKINSL